MTSSDNDSLLKPPELTEDIIYGYDGQTVLPIAVSDIECLIRDAAIVFNGEPVSVDVSCGLKVKIKDSSDPISISPRIEDDSYWDKVHGFTIEKGINYAIRVCSDPYPDIRNEMLIWKLATPYSVPERVKLEEHPELPSFLLYKEYRWKPFITSSIVLFEYSYEWTDIAQVCYPIMCGPDLDRRFANSVHKLIPGMTKERLKELFSPENKEEK